MLMTRQIHTPLFCSLYGNDLGEQTGVALGEALKVNASLQALR